jgi:nitrite reductase (NADH) large subunit
LILLIIVIDRKLRGNLMKYLIIGSGAAGVSAVEEIIDLDEEAEVTIISQESYPFYYRPRLIECLSGERTIADIIIRDRDWFAEQGIELNLEETAQEVKPAEKKVETNRGTYTYDKLLLAMGASPFTPPISGCDKENVFTFRWAEDAENIYHQAEQASRAVVVGGGLLGLESAYNLSQAGLAVDVLEVEDYLLPRQLDKQGGAKLKQLLEEKGLNFYLEATAAQFIGDEGLTGVKLDSGEIVQAELALLSTGIRSNTELVSDLEGLEVGRSVVVNRQLETSLDDIYAAGDVAICNGDFYELWNFARREGKVAGKNMAGQSENLTSTVTEYKLKVVGIEVVSAGKLSDLEDYEVSVTEAEDKYRKIVMDQAGNKVGAVIVGDFPDTDEIIAEIKANN